MSLEPAHGLLQAITALSPQSVWTVGTQGMQTLGPDDERPLVEHLSGGRWHTLATPTLEWVNLNVLAVAAASASDVDAVGSIDLQGGLPLILHWNGHDWSRLPTTGLPAAGVNLTGVVAFRHGIIWVAGAQDRLAPRQRPLLARWNGNGWQQAETPQPQGAINALTAASPTNIWAAGGSQQHNGSHSLLENYTCT
jgi:hypothetical protein